MLSMIRADGQLQRRSVVNVAMALLRRAQHVEKREKEEAQYRRKRSREGSSV